MQHVEAETSTVYVPVEGARTSISAAVLPSLSPNDAPSGPRKRIRGRKLASGPLPTSLPTLSMMLSLKEAGMVHVSKSPTRIPPVFRAPPVAGPPAAVGDTLYAPG